MRNTGAQTWFVGIRDITSTTNERTVISAVLPLSGVGNNLPILLLDRRLIPLGGLLSACLSSLPLDFAARLKVGGLHLNFFIVNQFPVASPSAYDVPCPWASPQTIGAWLLARVLELTYTAWDIEPFAQDCGWSGPPFRWDEERRFLLRCELDAAFFHLYLPAEANGDWRLTADESAPNSLLANSLLASFPTPRDAVAYIMDTFPIVKRKDEEKHGDYRTKRVILEIYDAMQESIRTGRPYQTRLDPPPADPRCCHPARDGKTKG